MLAVLGFVTILLVLALIMSKKVSTLVALIFVPAITGFIAAFINAPKPHRLLPKRPELPMLSRSSRSAPALPRHFPSSAQIIWARA